ncbi:MAG TPA: sigma 54-interacting transcriptional regulator, partial [Burkholderiaceae bacterium]
GYEEGAFTGARKKGSIGKILQANGGTLFLDEIGDMPKHLQARLLRVLQERQVVPLGAHAPVAVDVALISATHRDPRALIAAQAFREDLYYRLNGLAVKLPPLRERSDLAILVQSLLASEGEGAAPQPSPEVMERLLAYRWPGNLRQLANVLRSAALMAAGERQITLAHLSDDFLEESQPSPPAPPAPATAEPAALPAGRLEEAELALIRAALDAEGGNVSAASKRLGIARNTIYRRLRWNVRAR